MAAAMFAFGFAMVPLYDVLCDVTGFGGRSINNASTVPDHVDTSREVTVEFVESVGKHAYMEFRPKDARIRLHPGEVVSTSFFARNMNDTEITSQAIYNVAPAEGSLYFHKTECFCFTQQDFKAGEEKEMPLIFTVSPELPEGITTVSLAYTIFDRTKPKQLAQLSNQGE
jgi:cytochrome c oxidase assembly protein subunit 11